MTFIRKSNLENNSSIKETTQDIPSFKFPCHVNGEQNFIAIFLSEQQILILYL